VQWVQTTWSEQSRGHGISCLSDTIVIGPSNDRSRLASYSRKNVQASQCKHPRLFCEYVYMVIGLLECNVKRLMQRVYVQYRSQLGSLNSLLDLLYVSNKGWLAGGNSICISLALPVHIVPTHPHAHTVSILLLKPVFPVVILVVG
jgi:hypothetical protein